MEITQILQILKYIMLFLVPIIALIGMYKIEWGAITQNTNDKIKQQVLDLLTDEDEASEHTKYFDLVRIDKYLRANGGYYMFGDIDAFTFVMIKMGCALLFFIVGFSLVKNSMILALLVGIILGVAGFFGFDLLITVSNESDNDEMLDDIKSIFDTLKIQTKAGVFLTNSLTECYMTVRNDRLKAALLDMTNKIIIKNDIETAVNEFNTYFNNPYIDTLCITIIQSMESGKSVQILEDLSKQIADMQTAINIREQEKLDSQIQLMEVLIFIGMIGSVLYVLILFMYESFIGW